MRCHELFPADRGLQARMVLVSVLTPLAAGALLAVCAFVLPLKMLIPLGILVVFGVRGALREQRGIADAAVLGPGDEPELQAIVDRLCVVADLPRPEIAVDPEAQPNSWIVDAPGRPPRLHVTRGLLDLLEPVELEAVIAHELSHVAHRDATVMTVVGLPSAALLRGRLGDGGWVPMLVAAQMATMGIGLLAGFGSTALSRYRELTADAGAVAITGRPAALASALMKVSGALTVLPSKDLRAVAGRDALHLVGVGKAQGVRRLHGPTHPSIERRVAALERLEHRVAHGRRA